MKPRTVLLCVAAGILAAVAACSGVNVSLGGHPQQASVAGTSGVGAGAADAMAGSNAAGGLNVIDNEPVPCAPDKPTIVSGKVWDPKGRTELYNAVVYIPDIPSGELPPFPKTVACEKCTDTVPALATALSGPDGSFRLDTDVPNTPYLDVVVQLGKWRRRQRVKITPCQETALAKDDTRLPKNRTDSNYGIADLPKIALSTGHSDALECLLRKIGISDSEFSTDADNGSVNMFVGCTGDQANQHTGAAKFVPSVGGGKAFPSTNQLFDTPGELDKYDVVIFSCEGHKCDAIQTPAHIDQLVAFANKGGRVYLDHDHYNWLNHAGDRTGDRIEAAVQFSSSQDGVPSPLTATINASPGFYKGQDFAQWLVNVGASTTLGQLDIFSGRTSVQSIDPNRAQSWIFRDPAVMWPDVFYLTIGTPVAVKDGDPAPEACGRVVFTDLHVNKSGGGCPDAGASCGESDDVSDQTVPFPAGCTSIGLLPQEKALEFMIFDLTSCVQKETQKPIPPVIVK